MRLPRTQGVYDNPRGSPSVKKADTLSAAGNIRGCYRLHMPTINIVEYKHQHRSAGVGLSNN